MNTTAPRQSIADQVEAFESARPATIKEKQNLFRRLKLYFGDDPEEVKFAVSDEIGHDPKDLTASEYRALMNKFLGHDASGDLIPVFAEDFRFCWDAAYEKAEAESPTLGLDNAPIVGSTDLDMLKAKAVEEDSFAAIPDAAPIHKADLLREIETLESAAWKTNADRMSNRSEWLDDLGLDVLPKLNIADLLTYRDALKKGKTYIEKLEAAA